MIQVLSLNKVSSYSCLENTCDWLRDHVIVNTQRQVKQQVVCVSLDLDLILPNRTQTLQLCLYLVCA